MAKELAFVLINPYTLAKSRTGGVIARYLSRTNLNIVAARMFRPSLQLAQQYADHVRSVDGDTKTGSLIADYILRAYSPDPSTGRPRRVMLLLFEGEDAIRKIWEVTGSATVRSCSGQTIRDTYGDYIVDDEGRVQYFEPAVLVAPTKDRAEHTLKIWQKYSATDGGLVETATDVPTGDHVEKTLVMLKPDNFKFPSSRPGNIIDVLSRSGLRIVGIKKFRMTVAQAEAFYGPVEEALRKKFKSIGAGRTAEALRREFGFEVPSPVLDEICEKLAPLFGRSQFESIVEFMTGYKPSDVKPSEKATAGREECLALVYEGENAIQTIRNILGPTDPRKAAPGSVRREYGRDIMVNAAHASDSPASYQREQAIIRIEEDTITPWIQRYYGSPIQRAKTLLSQIRNPIQGLKEKIHD